MNGELHLVQAWKLEPGDKGTGRFKGEVVRVTVTAAEGNYALVMDEDGNQFRTRSLYNVTRRGETVYDFSITEFMEKTSESKQAGKSRRTGLQLKRRLGGLLPRGFLRYLAYRLRQVTYQRKVAAWIIGVFAVSVLVVREYGEGWGMVGLFGYLILSGAAYVVLLDYHSWRKRELEETEDATTVVHENPPDPERQEEDERDVEPLSEGGPGNKEEYDPSEFMRTINETGHVQAEITGDPFMKLDNLEEEEIDD